MKMTRYNNYDCPPMNQTHIIYRYFFPFLYGLIYMHKHSA